MERMVDQGGMLIWDGVGEANQLTVLLLLKERNAGVESFADPGDGGSRVQLGGSKPNTGASRPNASRTKLSCLSWGKQFWGPPLPWRAVFSPGWRRPELRSQP